MPSPQDQSPIAAAAAAGKPAIDPQALRQALGQFPTGVAVVTTVAPDGRPVGLTINSFAALSLDPPLVLWSLMNRSPSLAAFSACSHFVVHVLAAGQTTLARQFASAGLPDKFAGIDWQPGPGGAPLLAGALAQFICRPHRQDESGDHTLFIGRVDGLHQQSGEPGEPAVFHRGRFAALAG